MDIYSEEDDKSNNCGISSIYFLTGKNFIVEEENSEKNENTQKQTDSDNLDADKEKPTKNNTNDKEPENKLFDDESSVKSLVHKNILENNKKKKIFKKKSGKLKLSNSRAEHNKFSDDNLRRKCKHLVLKYLLPFINERIILIYKGKIGKGLCEKQLKVINQSQIKNVTLYFNKNFMETKIKDIFSANITKKYNYYPTSFNKELINKLLNESDETKRIYFQKLFNLEFIECLRHFRGEKKIDILEGFKCFTDIKDDIVNQYENDGLKYYEAIKHYLNNFEEIILKKKPRKPIIKNNK